MRRAVELLKSDGLLPIQTPDYRSGARLDSIVACGYVFLIELKSEEHLSLFTQPRRSAPNTPHTPRE